MAQETFDWSSYYSDEQSGTTTTFTSATSGTVDVTVSQPDPFGDYRNGRDGFEANSTMGGDGSGYFEMGVNFDSNSDTLTTTIDFASNSISGEDSVTDVSFTLYDIDSTTGATFQDQVTVLAFDTNGNALTVTMTAVDGTVVSTSGGVATAVPGGGNGNSGTVSASDVNGNVDVSVSGEVAEIRIIYGNGSSADPNPANQAVGFGDLTFDLTPAVVCFVAGTPVLAEHGAVPAEALRPGDRVWTLDHGLQTLRWVGRRQVRGRGPLAPVRFAPGVLGNEAPLELSPQHRVLLGGARAELLTGRVEVLAHAVHLVDGVRVARAPRDTADYVHLMFDRHEIVQAGGVLCESLFTGTGRMRARVDSAVGAFGVAPPSVSLPQHDLARPVVRAHEAALIGPARPAGRLGIVPGPKGVSDAEGLLPTG